MSLTLVTALQMGWVLVCYTALTLALPTLVFWRKLKHMGTAERFLFYDLYIWSRCLAAQRFNTCLKFCQVLPCFYSCVFQNLLPLFIDARQFLEQFFFFKLRILADLICFRPCLSGGFQLAVYFINQIFCMQVIRVEHFACILDYALIQPKTLGNCQSI